MGLKIANLQQWLTRNRLLLWWVIFLPLLVIIIIINRDSLDLPAQLLNNPLLGFQEKVFSAPALIILTRIALIAVGLVIIMICLFFPLFQVGKEGVRWTKELEEELAMVSGEITGEEIGRLIREESFRWTLIHNWIKLKEPEPADSHLLLRELLATIWEAFPMHKLSLCLLNAKNCLGITHPLLTRLILSETLAATDDERNYRLQLQFPGDEFLVLRVYTNDPEGFSQIDEKFITVLGEIFMQKVMRPGITPEQILANFDQIPLTAKNAEGYNERR